MKVNQLLLRVKISDSSLFSLCGDVGLVCLYSTGGKSSPAAATTGGNTGLPPTLANGQLSVSMQICFLA